MDHPAVTITMPFVVCILLIKFVTEAAHGKGRVTAEIENEAKAGLPGPPVQLQPDAAASSEHGGT